MGSGNFLIGSGLKLEGFTTFIEPILKEQGYFVGNRLALGKSWSNEERILFSLSKGDNLEKAVKESLIKARKDIELYEDKFNKNKKPGEVKIAWAHQIREEHYEIIGIYNDDKTASMNFPLIAQKYLCEVAKKSVYEVEEKLRRLANSKLSDFMQR